MQQTRKVGDQVPSSTGGVITYTKTGLVHSAGRAYSGKTAESELTTDKKGRVKR